MAGLAKAIGEGVVRGLGSGGGITGALIGGARNILSTPSRIKSALGNKKQREQNAIFKQQQKAQNAAIDAEYNKYRQELSELGDSFGEGTPKPLSKQKWLEKREYEAKPLAEKRKLGLEKANKQKMENFKRRASENRIVDMFGSNPSKAKQMKDLYFAEANKRANMTGQKLGFSRRDLDNPNSKVFKDLSNRRNAILKQRQLAQQRRAGIK